MAEANESFVTVTRKFADEEIVDEYPLPLPMLPSYREMNLIKRLTHLTIGEILLGAGSDPDADFAVAVYAIKRANPAFDMREAEALFDLPFGAIEIHFAEEEEEGGSPEAPRPESRADAPESDSSSSDQPS